MGYSSCRVVLQCLKYNQSFKTVNKISNSEKDAWFWRLNCKYQNKEVWIELRTLIANNRIWWYSSSNINSPFKTVIILDWKIVILTTIMRPRYEFYQILNPQNCQKFWTSLMGDCKNHSTNLMGCFSKIKFCQFFSLNFDLKWILQFRKVKNKEIDTFGRA